MNRNNKPHNTMEHGHRVYGQYLGVYSHICDPRSDPSVRRGASEDDCPARSTFVQEVLARRWLLAEHPGRLDRFNAALARMRPLKLDEAVKALGAMEEDKFREWKERIG